ncbi:aminocarboxymuconate-semialdehyde decarboxylase [Syntrophus gentianae]|uniref:Aminocarboxymuconate-semialdehyde decarboxylase n=1 Tax=Syntrophus gentianae TaxID=43775 RepID=A0A1H7VRB9_9BACT|nr:amidohydrolase family protein [Syntrophus gentianae]SEM11338.1 aminocarboxymuconate-semialdehyde decarboxylase [Syntrophus gentianae]
MAQRTVDAHNHFYTKEYLDYLVSRGTTAAMHAVHDGGTHYRVWQNGVCTAHIDRAGHYDLDARIKDLDAAGLDTQVLTQTIPGPETLPHDEGLYWAKKCNDGLAAAMEKYPGRFYFMATLPYQDVDAACEELERCYKMGCRGIQMFSNFNGEPVYLEKFHPIYEIANKYELPFLVHPAYPLTADVMTKMKIPFQLWGYTLDTSMAVMSLIFQGVFEKYPKLTLVHGHLGGTVPYFVRRIQDSYKGYAKEWGIELKESPDITYKTRVYPDTTSFYLPAMKCCLEWVGPGQMGIGTDYAHRVGDPEGAIKAVKDLGSQAGLNQDEIDMILGKNFEKIFKLPPLK